MINMIAAIDRNMGIGKNNSLLTHIKSDLEYFKNTTEGQVVVMGYNTYLSLLKKPLPNRINIVITKKDIFLEGVVVVHSIQDALDKFKEYDDKKIFICGGASIYKQMMPYADTLYITHIFDNFDADSFFPEIDNSWMLDCIKAKEENIKHQHPHIFCIYKKITN